MRLTGSRYHLAILCAYPFRPDVDVRDTTQSEAAALGSEAHLYVETVCKGGDVGPLFLSENATRIGKQVMGWLATQPKPTAVEIKLVYDAATDTARMVDEAKYPGARNYGPTTASEIPVTLDMVWDLGSSVRCRDLKTGKKDYAHREQLVIQALAASRYYGRQTAEIGFVWGRLTKCEADPIETLEADDLIAAGWEVAATMTGIPNATTATGSHCYFCPARKQGCPAHAEPTEQERTEAYG